mmetsp:Transcript_23124/g.36302  ORF Transcript_23124/g.36302 Transcript_23124/m.36302 type:complete len:96 (+) Transcript_23124:252-539(+)|eukprot:CAMPEP_0201611610 /NCGR_PEP_ID=MMETSP0492-20130828/20595_1 /ASSEMBLY_ACC=CAM_ASM_000837 /TAXON_ID=420259 /ORGANISM="Thalassiosira gravida, Strain GMp14c1" /LENGTH=95 /DNA_ID=CAMNT_0048077847 /DNA_START=193 /DNA_END=480 /DNA_ORIENTATION=-
MTLRHPKQLLSQSPELAIMDGPILITFDEGALRSCPDDTSIVCADDDTTKLAIFEEEIGGAGVNADDDRIGSASNPFFPFDLSPLLDFILFPFPF